MIALIDRSRRPCALAAAAAALFFGLAVVGAQEAAPGPGDDVPVRGSLHGEVASVNRDRGVLIVRCEDDEVELRATPHQLAELEPEQRDFPFVRYDESRWLAGPGSVDLERGPTAEYVVGVVSEVDLREGILWVDADERTVALRAHPQQIAGLHRHQDVVVAAERTDRSLWVVAVREPDPAELVDDSRAPPPLGRLQRL